MTIQKHKKRVFSGVQPSGVIHIGNYLGAIRHWVNDQDKYDNIFCIVDEHAITVPQDPRVLRGKIRELAKIYLACGLDENKTSIFVQSHVSEHAELTWILNCITPMGWLYRMTQFKDKSDGEKKENVNTGLFDYPVLMASDILLYKTQCVPVGDDQRQHVELTREIARRFNSLFGETFVMPEALIREKGSRIMGLDDPSKKMSKSSDNKYNSISLLDSPDEIKEKIAKSVTDSGKEIKFDSARAGIYNLLVIYELFSEEKREKIEERFSGKGYSQFKKELAELIIGKLNPIQEKYRKISNDSLYIDNVLKSGSDKAKPIAKATLDEVKNKVGLG